MKLKDLEKVTKIYELIKPIDADLIRFDKLAQSVADSNSIVKLNLDITDLKMKNNGVRVIDEDGNLISSNDTPVLGPNIKLKYDYTTGTMTQIITKPDYESSITQELSDLLTLELIGLLIKNKQEQKKTLLNKLIKYKIIA